MQFLIRTSVDWVDSESARVQIPGIVFDREKR